MEALFGMLIVFFIGLIWVTPFILLIKSNRVEGGKKILWLLIMLFISWFAWLIYLALVPKQEIKPRFKPSE